MITLTIFRTGSISLATCSALLITLSLGCGTRDRSDSMARAEIALADGGRHSLAYKGHEHDRDSDNLVTVYPDLGGSRLDDCQTCHTTGIVRRESRRGDPVTTTLNPCSYCHLVPFPDERVLEGSPDGFLETLNPYGRAYGENGRDADALRRIAPLDSDGDGFTNLAEVAALRYPGDPTSQPGQLTAPFITLEMEDLLPLADHTQLMLLNSYSKRSDSYGVYRGVILKELLASLGITLTRDQSVTFLAPDGYAVDLAAEHINNPQPPGRWYPGLAAADLDDPEQGFVHYPPEKLLPPGLTVGGEIPGVQWVMIALWSGDEPLRPTTLDLTSGRIVGEGPYRSLIPQGTCGEPGAPDRGARYSPTTYHDGLDFDPKKDHNTGLGVRGLVALRINPISADLEEFDWKNGGFAMVARRQLIVYGAGVGSR